MEAPNMQGTANNLEIIPGLLATSAEEGRKPISVEPYVALPGVIICILEVSLYYGNAESFMNEMLSSVANASLGVRWFILQFNPTEGVDYIAAKMLTELADRMGRQQVTLVFAELSADLREILSDSGVLEVVCAAKLFASVAAALAACNPCKLIYRQRWRRVS